MKKNKYYTPEITEFHVGFEFERLSELPTNHWENSVCSTYNDLLLMQRKINESLIRVKCLDKQDIESFGFKLFHKEEDRAILYKLNKSLLTYVEDQFINIHILNQDKDVFQSNIKNKSELEFILKRLNIV